MSRCCCRSRRTYRALPVNGSASLFRDVVDFGFWGLRRGCAVVYTDKGRGNRFDMLEQDCVSACKIDPLRGVIGVQN